MKIALGNNYILNGDAYNYWLSKTIKPKKEGNKPYERVCSGYFNNIEDVFESALKRGIMENDAESFKELIKHIDKTKREIKKAIKTLKEVSLQ